MSEDRADPPGSYSPVKMRGDVMWVDVTSLMTDGIEPWIDRLNANPDAATSLGLFIKRLNQLLRVNAANRSAIQNHRKPGSRPSYTCPLSDSLEEGMPGLGHSPMHASVKYDLHRWSTRQRGVSPTRAS